ncbi:hypothetical protein [Anaerohalosphaera lusitana]|uniref:hypothetical protein n=1 Tax=Anaerohalosphaera lusitana TaxID=1936003 RepID=UPI001474E13A|nr:hypothetical protein [Anaerohalosphaera lusitana]
MAVNAVKNQLAIANHYTIKTSNEQEIFLDIFDAAALKANPSFNDCIIAAIEFCWPSD